MVDTLANFVELGPPYAAADVAALYTAYVAAKVRLAEREAELAAAHKWIEEHPAKLRDDFK